MAGKKGRRIPIFEADLIELGWAFKKECNCGGKWKIYYSKAGNELKVLPGKNRFYVRFKQQIVLQGNTTDMKILLQSI